MCIINNSKKFIFIHVPKCAGTTLTNYYAQYSSCRDIEIGGSQIGETLQPYFRKRFGLSKHATITEIDMALGENVIDEYFTFGFVRNPYDRVISSFTFLRKWQDWNGHQEIIKINDINDYIMSDFFKGEGVDRQNRVQSFWLGDSTNSRCVNYWGKVEEIQTAVAFINSKIGINEADVSLPTRNASRQVDANQNIELRLSAESIQIINDRYAADFEQYGYSQKVAS
ncbi:Sulfotransferase family protein [Allochromatium warmingii]|uniref:Sulfotransferase family protein n=1 Tax=Allochromatium warmingii TaxID=61595 RepID=A0A1H3E3H7_ALLWA|nr:sulfotransferase family 2 domain-containing protein [Allochromatium warmingii]SDX72494.1 Sulfotransferase family protein [Allochromatium warmingii]